MKVESGCPLLTGVIAEAVQIRAQERFGNGQRFPFIDGNDSQFCQRREWLLHSSQDLFYAEYRRTTELDFMYAIGVFEYRDDIIHVPHSEVTAPNVDRQGWPGIQHHPHRPPSNHWRSRDSRRRGSDIETCSSDTGSL